MEKILEYYFDDGSYVKFDKCSVVTEIPHIFAHGRRYSIMYTRFVDTRNFILTTTII